MISNWKPTNRHRPGFTLPETLVCFFIFSLVISGLIFGYTEINRMAEYSAMSLAAQSAAEEGLEQARSALWVYDQTGAPETNEPNSQDQLGFVVGSSYTTNIVDTLDVPSSGAPFLMTNYITITYVLTNLNPILPPMRQIMSTVVWTLPQHNGAATYCTNTAIALRAPDQ